MGLSKRGAGGAGRGASARRYGVPLFRNGAWFGRRSKLVVASIDVVQTERRWCQRGKGEGGEGYEEGAQGFSAGVAPMRDERNAMAGGDEVSKARGCSTAGGASGTHAEPCLHVSAAIRHTTPTRAHPIPPGLRSNCAGLAGRGGCMRWCMRCCDALRRAAFRHSDPTAVELHAKIALLHFCHAVALAEKCNFGPMDGSTRRDPSDEIPSEIPCCAHPRSEIGSAHRSHNSTCTVARPTASVAVAFARLTLQRRTRRRPLSASRCGIQRAPSNKPVCDSEKHLRP